MNEKQPNPSMEVMAPEQGEFPVLTDAQTRHEIMLLIAENLGGQAVSPLTLPRIRVPSGGAMEFRYETADGEKSARTLEGIIVAYRMARVYWKKKGTSKKPPDCSSSDGFVGVGDPGGDCKTCPFARFGSAIGLDGQPSGGMACKDLRQTLILLPGELLPHMLNVPPTSVKAFTAYSLTLISAHAPYWAITTRLSLEKATSGDGNDYAKIAFRLGRRMDREHAQVFDPYRKKMRDFLIPSVVDASAYETGDEPEEQQPYNQQDEPDDSVPF